MTDSKPTRILFVGEAVTAAHAIRPLGLARALDRSRFEPVFACDPRCRRMVSGEAIRYEPIHSVPSAAVLDRVMRGAPFYTLDELRRYVQEDLRLIAKVKPDAIVGDFRHSMGIAAELTGIPHLALCNLHWSPNARLPVPLPEHWLVQWFGVRLMRRILPRIISIFLKRQVRATNRLRRWYGLAPLGGDGAREVYTCGTRALYLDVPELYGSMPLAQNERCIGPVLWAPETDLPDWWDTLPTERPLAWVTPGSSGDGGVMEMAASALIEAGFAVMVATAGRMRAPNGAYVADFLPGLKAAGRADLIVCNGGSGLVYQALAQGKPVLGVPRNMDQYYVMEAVERQGAGRLLRSGKATADSVVQAASAILADRAMKAAAERLARAIAAREPARELGGIVLETLGEDGKPHGEESVVTEKDARWPVREPALAR